MAEGRKSVGVAPTRKGMLARQNLLEAGRKAFSTYGYEARVADVVRLAQVSHGNFYRYFIDKDDLLHAVLDELHQGLQKPSPLDGRPAPEGLSEEMIDRNQRFFHKYAENRDMLLVAREAAAKPAPSRFLDTWLELRSAFIERNIRWMRRLQAEGGLSTDLDVVQYAEALGSMTEQLAYVKIGLVKARPSSAELDEMGRTCGLIWFRSLFATETAERIRLPPSAGKGV